MTDNASRRRAIHATRAVTLGGFALAATACGTTPEPLPDTGEDVANDTAVDTAPDTGPDVVEDTAPDTMVPDTNVPDTFIDVGLEICNVEEADGVCPADCDSETDIDCCYDWGGGPDWCDYSPEWGCSCAVEGPFAPPAFR